MVAVACQAALKKVQIQTLPRMTNSRVPVVRQVSWVATIPQIVAVATAIGLGWFIAQSPAGGACGAAVYLLYSFASRKWIPRDHRRGIRLSQNHQFAEAIVAHQESYDFFTRHTWLDRYRSITMMSPGAMTFREMALINIAFAHSQLGDGAKAKECYRRALAEFPNSAMAAAAVKMIEAFEAPP